ncbi:DUF1499 domain-containing protein [Marinobacter sp. 2_MG-2023]|uniref:DUF1499 domain-containing protein n=1 Tax=Marinobacter sp. 2_MG-2023 TaxID=3062679 RepID=UPI0026E3885B|nr:DUF1499 domain-containing protein [Marinobacter sp. 2_MG-2023]MDO6442033.1 DUF1499 domain-containing protein [Marinobacter sp. 2_MG-2023]
MLTKTNPPRRGGKWPAIIAWLGVILLITAGVLMAVAGPAYRAELIELGTSFTWLRQGAQLAAGAAVLGLITLVLALVLRRWRPALVGALVCIVVGAMIAMPMQMKQRAQSVPPIHDITTDTNNPPAFILLAAAREEAPNAVDYPGAETARQQQAAYPQLKAMTLSMPMASVMEAARSIIQARGWEIAGTTANTIEATATTRWFGFKDDVVIRMAETETGVQVDMRSASRVGKSDLGANAERVQAFLEDLAKR